MPLPRPLKKSASKKKKTKRMGEVMSELNHGPVESPARKATHGEQRHKQDVAIAMKEAGMSKKKAPTKTAKMMGQPMKGRSAKRKRPRNKGRS